MHRRVLCFLRMLRDQNDGQKVSHQELPQPISSCDYKWPCVSSWFNQIYEANSNHTLTHWHRQKSSRTLSSYSKLQIAPSVLHLQRRELVWNCVVQKQVEEFFCVVCALHQSKQVEHVEIMTIVSSNLFCRILAMSRLVWIPVRPLVWWPPLVQKPEAVYGLSDHTWYIKRLSIHAICGFCVLRWFSGRSRLRMQVLVLW